MAERKGYSLYFVTPDNPGVWFDMTPGIREMSRDRSSLNQHIPLPHGAIYRGLNGEGLGSIQLSGTFGMKARQIDGISMTGTEVLLYLEQMIGEYLKATASPDPNVSKKASVEWHDWEDDYHLHAEPQGISFSRGPSNKVHRVYSLRLETYGVVQRKLANQVVDKRSKAAQYLKAMKVARERIKSTEQVLRRENDRFKSLIEKYVTKPINGIVDALEDFTSGLTGWVDVPFESLISVGTNINAAISSIADTGSEVVVRFAMNLRQVARIVNRLAATPEIFKATFEQAGREFAGTLAIPLSENDTELEREEYLTGTNADRIQRAIRVAQTSAQGARKIPVLAGDTLQSIALRELRDVSRWFEISILNGYLDNNDLSSVTEILVPSEDGVGSLINQQLSSTSFLSADERLYGKDLATVVTSRGKLSVFFGVFDLALVSGKKNLTQAVRHMDHVQQGELLEDPDYGIRAIVGSSIVRQNAAALAWSLRETAESDPRISKCEVQVSTEGNVTYYERTITPAGSTSQIPAGSIAGGV